MSIASFERDIFDRVPKSFDQNDDSVGIAPHRALWWRIFLPRFSLRTMLILVTLFSVNAAWIGNWIYRSEEQRVAIEKIVQGNEYLQKLVVYDYEYIRNSGGYWEHDSSASSVSSRIPKFFLDRLGKDYFHDVASITSCSRDRKQHDLSFDALNHLRKIRSLHVRHYNLSLPQISKLFSAIEKMQELEDLELYSDNWILGKEEIQVLKNLPKLKGLQSITEHEGIIDLETLAELTSLEKLELSGPNISADQIQSLKSLKNLKVFVVYENAVAKELDSAIVSMIAEQWPNMEQLGLLNQMKVSDLSHLKNLKRLKKLTLADTMTSRIDEAQMLLPNINVEQFRMRSY